MDSGSGFAHSGTGRASDAERPAILAICGRPGLFLGHAGLQLGAPGRVRGSVLLRPHRLYGHRGLHERYPGT